ncbi:TldD/PmbA family protein [Planktothrix sp. FACHB-1355]|uniref:TldD/PmbA family protein n=1 Tax=Aerosakkonema funiforme FACHB-1375 TaxID=2949571 RepID=A0A926VJL0_9CYAN|nr:MULTISPECIES: TldD/PmbA family protein [Oscillatoriales]MBD2183927.1 TldD/PmbA family protein [Aerosakkonema funiforme FACHB-1375]MBD3560149.1 TldD/PmbA family protein [Planktothrix sp. FACHB-1355]
MGSDNLQPKALAEQLLELAAKSGAEAAEVYQSRSLSKPVFFEANRLKQLESAQAEGTALRLWKEGRPGLAVAYGPVEPKALIERAIALSDLNEPEPIELVADSIASYPDEGKAVSVDRLVAWGKEAIALIRDAYPEVLVSAEWECEVETTRLVNSHGLDRQHSDTTLSCYLGAEWVRGDDFLSVSDGQTQRDRLDPAALAQQILLRLDWAQENVAPPTGRVPVLFTAKAADMLWGTVQAALNGKMVVEGASPWSDRLSCKVIADILTLSQQPDRGPFSCPFDDEGTPTRTLTFIRNGTLQLFYADITTGRRLGSGTTGNAIRPGLGSYPTPGLFNLSIEPGSGSMLDLIAQIDDGLVVDQILGGGPGISGDFSVNVDLGYRVQQGKIVGRVKDTMVAGNVYTALKQILTLGGDAEWNGNCYTPSLIVEGLSVTGRI